MFQAILFIYSILYFFFLLFYLPAVIFQSVFRKKKTQIAKRIKSGLPSDGNNLLQKKIWIHAVSVGEVNASLALTRKLINNGCKVFFSTTTVTGQQVARSALGSSVTLFYFPLDFKILCRSALRRIRPDVVAIMETEIWPNFLESARREKIPVVFINGRISDQSIKNYQLITPLLKPVFDRIAVMCMQSDIDARRAGKIGAPGKIIRVTGNMKFDYSLDIPAEKKNLQSHLGSLLLGKPGSQLWICGSTKPNEEEIIASIYNNLKSEFPALSLLIAPRHPHRGEEVYEIFSGKGCRTRRRSLLDQGKARPADKCDVLVLDTVGELAYLYEIADIVFMGGSLVPTGGQNVIEPAFFGKPILFGPSMTNFREIAEIFKTREAAVQVHSPRDLEREIRSLLRDEDARSALGRNARGVLEDNRGAVGRNLDVINSLIDNRDN